MPAFLGMRGTGEWPENAQPENWRETILYLYPNGQAPLTAIMSMMGSRDTDDPRFHWFEKDLPHQAGDVANVFIDAALGTAATNSNVADGDVVYAQMSALLVSEFRVGHQVMFEKKGDIRFETRGKVVGRLEAGASSYIAVRLIEAPQGDGANNINHADFVSVVGNSNPEGAPMPDAITYDPRELDNFTQIFRTPLELTRTARRTRLRYGSESYALAKRECLELHAIELEKAFIWSGKSLTQGFNGKPERTTMGIIPALREFAPGNIVDYRLDTDFSGQTWLQGGADWLTKVLGNLEVFGANEKLALHGNLASVGLRKLADAGVEFQWEPGKTMDYGIDVRRWIQGGLTLNLKGHPLFNTKPTYQDAMLILEPARYQYVYIDDTHFKTDPEDRTVRNNSIDATQEEFLTECGLEHHHIRTSMLLTGIGHDNVIGL